MFNCTKTGTFINVLYVCDKISDCPFSEDEKDCIYDTKYRFQCTNSLVSISLSLVCDHISDCPDGSDETFCGMINF